MKKLSIFASLAAAAVIFVGCGGGGGGGYVPPAPGPGPGPGAPVIWYLDDINGVGMAGVPYYCDSGSGVTDADGGFAFYYGDACDFDLWGFPGDITFSLHIDDEFVEGVGGIPYDCDSGWSGTTDVDGSFIYDPDDYCTFYF